MSSEADGDGPWDHVARQLQAWRRDADEPSYAEIALRISRRRRADGADPVASRVGRTTVYDAFRLGRARVNLTLVREIADALDVPHPAVDELVKAGQVPVRPPASPVASPVAPAPEQDPQAATPRVALVMIGCVLLNLLGREFVNGIGLPVYLDMVGTALAAIVLGPWRGAAVGLLTNSLGVMSGGLVSLPFALVNVVGALVWGYGVHRFGLGRALVRFFALTLGVAVACTLTAVPLLMWLYGGSVGHDQDSLTIKLYALTHQHTLALWTGNLMTSVADKLMCAFVALVGASALGHHLPAVASDSPPPSSGTRVQGLSRLPLPSRPGATTP